MPDITIGDNSVIGAGSVVTKDIPSNVKILAGSPFGSYCKRLPILRKALVFLNALDANDLLGHEN